MGSFIIIISKSRLILGMIEHFSSELCLLEVEEFQLFAVSIPFFKEDAHIEMKFVMQIYHNSIQDKFDFGYDCMSNF